MVSAYSGMLRRKYGSKLDEKANQYLSYLTEGSARMERLLRDLRAFTHVSTHAGPAPEIDAECRSPRDSGKPESSYRREPGTSDISALCPPSACTSFSLNSSFKTSLETRFITGATLLHVSTSRRNRTEMSGGFQFRITGSGLPLNTRRRSLECSNAFTQPQIIPVRVWALQSANVLSSGLEDASGWNLNSEEVRRFSLPFQQQRRDSADVQRAASTDSVG